MTRYSTLIVTLDTLLSINLSRNSPSDVSIYGDLRFVLELNWNNEQHFTLNYLCRNCHLSKFYTPLWKPYQNSQHFYKNLDNFQGQEFLTWDIELTGQPNTFYLVKYQFAQRDANRFIFPQLLALFHFSEKVNGTFHSCPGHPLSPTVKPTPNCLAGKMNFFFSTSDYDESFRNNHHRFYTDGRFEISFLTYNYLHPGSFVFTALIGPIGFEPLLVTIALLLGISTLCHLLFAHEKLSHPNFVLLFASPLLSQEVKMNSALNTPASLKGFALKFVFTTWLVYCLIVTEIYRGNVYKYLFLPSYTAPPQNFDQLINSLDYSVTTTPAKFKSITSPGSEHAAIFASMLEKFEPKSFIMCCPGRTSDILDLFVNLTTKPVAFVGATEYVQILEVLFRQVVGPGSSSTSSDVVMGNKVWILYDRPGLVEASDVFKGLVVSGILERSRKRLYGTWAEIYVRMSFHWSATMQRFSEMFGSGRGSERGDRRDVHVKVLRFRNVQGFFIILLIGVGFSLGVFIGEILWGKGRNRVVRFNQSL
ncbi:hypothetical protein Fcan01_10872 [Folsomia candida]|uniref:Uncharacterized protein n=1 Tax=Folsomia candida TaxID=158441 RepID=A0A226EDS3_FOLCA|nr:hypothetical protein Fcan01_10872 [Folsomia candida]